MPEIQAPAKYFVKCQHTFAGSALYLSSSGSATNLVVSIRVYDMWSAADAQVWIRTQLIAHTCVTFFW